MVDEANQVLRQFGIDIDARTVMGELNLSQKQLVEIAKAIRKKAKIIVMDEPTSALSERDIKTLFSIVKRLKSSDISVIYISHHLDEVFEITDRVTVLRDGRNVGTLSTNETNRDELITLMVGRSISEMYPKERIEINTNYGTIVGDHFIEMTVSGFDMVHYRKTYDYKKKIGNQYINNFHTSFSDTSSRIPK